MRKGVAEWLRGFANLIEGRSRFDRQWQRFADSGDKVHAIREHRAVYGSSLMQAKTEVEDYMLRTAK